MTRKDPPMSLLAEEYVLRTLLSDDAAAWDIFAMLSATDFYRSTHRDYFAALASMHKARQPMDWIALHAEMQRRGQATPETMAELSDLLATGTGTANWRHHAGTVRDKAQARALIALSADVAERAYSDSPSELVAMMSQRLTTATASNTGSAKRFSEVYDATEQAIVEIRRRRDSGVTVGAPTGLRDLDARLGGLHGPKLIVIAARPATGKTALLNLAGVNAARHGFGTLICSLEMSDDALMVRALAAEAGVNVTKLSLGFTDEVDAGAEAYSRLGDIPLWIDTDSYDLDAICAQIALHRHRHGIQLAAVDHIGLVTTRQKFNSRNDQMGHISRTFKQLAKRLNIPVIALSQLSRECEKEKRRPIMSDLRDSGNIEQDADIVMFLHTPYDQRDQPTKPIEIGLAKNRGGRTGWIEGYEFDGATQRIYQPHHNVTPFYKDRSAA